MNRNSYQKENQPERITILGKLLRWIILKFVCLFVFTAILNAGQFPRNYPGLVGLFHFNGISNNVTTDYYYINSNNDIGNYVLGGIAPLLSDGKFSKSYLFRDMSPTNNSHMYIYISTVTPQSICSNNPRTFIWWQKLYSYLNSVELSTALFGYGSRDEFYRRCFIVLLGNGGEGNQNKLSLYYGNHSDDFLASTMVTGIICQLNQWECYAITYDGNNTVKFYKNGQFIESDTFSATLNTCPSELLFGEIYDVGAPKYEITHLGTSRYKFAIDGILDELIILNYQASDNEIKKIYQEQVGNYSQCEQ